MDEAVTEMAAEAAKKDFKEIVFAAGEVRCQLRRKL
jgi:hypothetical protein